MKRLLILAVLAAAAWAGTAASSQASSFGLCYSRSCGACSFCVRPYNAFSGVTCGVATCGDGAGFGHCGHGGCGPGGCAPGHGLCSWLFGSDGVGPPGDDGSGAFGNCGPKVAFYGLPCNRKGYNPGCHMDWGGGPVPVPGYSAPPGPYVTPPNYNCTNVFLPPQPFPGMYGIPPKMAGYPMPYPYAAPGMVPAPANAAPAANANQPAVKPVSYQQGYPAYNAYQPMTGWYYGYYMPQGYYYGWQGQGYGMGQ